MSKKVDELKLKIQASNSGREILRILDEYDGYHSEKFERLINFAHKHMKKVDMGYWNGLHHGFGKIILTGGDY